MKGDKKPTVAVIIITFNGSKFINKCLNSLKEQTYPKKDFSVIVVDNASTDNSIDLIEKNHSTVKLIKNKENSGFGSACNIGIREANSVDYVILLNQDSWVEKDWLEQLVKVMEKNQKAGCCGAAEHDYDEKPVSESKKKNESTKAGCWMGGGSLIIRKKALDDAGLFDEIYFMYGEDMDLTWRIQIAGWIIIKTSKAIWHHHGRKRSVSSTDWRVYYSWRNRIFVLLKFGSTRQIISSIKKYFTYFMYGRKKSVNDVTSSENIGNNNQNAVQRQNIFRRCNAILRKMLFATKIIVAVLVYSPFLLQRRMLLKNNNIDYEKIDSWIRETDMQFYGL